MSAVGSLLLEGKRGAEPIAVRAARPTVALRRFGGRPLDDATRAAMEPRFGHDFSKVRVHTDHDAAGAAKAQSAAAYTSGVDIGFAAGRYQPGTTAGQRLIAHELAHVVQQQGAIGQHRRADGKHEVVADEAAESAVHGGAMPTMPAADHGTIQRTVEMRDVGSREQSGFSRLPELLDRLNAMAAGVTFSVTAGGEAERQVRDYEGRLVRAGQTVELRYERLEGKTPSHFETQMMGFIDQAAVVPLRLTNRHGLLGSTETGYTAQVDVDAWRSGYVDIDDLLASSDLGLQSVLLHFVRERSATANYSRRIGGDTFTDPEFLRVHGLGTEAEERLLQDYFGDPTIRLVNDSPSVTVRRVFRNSRRDLIRRIITRGRGAETGVGGSTIDVITRTGERLTAEEYRRRLEEERTAAQIERERLRGAGEHMVGGRLIPAP
jgi:hypothetical protein